MQALLKTSHAHPLIRERGRDPDSAPGAYASLLEPRGHHNGGVRAWAHGGRPVVTVARWVLVWPVGC
eukprot:2191624-Pyramimonas_sp.AAC.1